MRERGRQACRRKERRREGGREEERGKVCPWIKGRVHYIKKLKSLGSLHG